MLLYITSWIHLDCLVSSQWPAAQARAALEDRRVAQEQQLKRAQLQAPFLDTDKRLRRWNGDNLFVLVKDLTDTFKIEDFMCSMVGFLK